MNLTDNAVIFVKGGNGGKGCVSFRREKYIPKGGPDGGNGGNGGNVWIYSDKNTHDLYHCLVRKNFIAEDGENGKKNNSSGKNGKDVIIKVPIGTNIFFIKNSENIIFGHTRFHNQKFLVAKGGVRGLGNNYFKSPTNRTPMESTLGKLGESFKIKLDFVFLADVGLFGYSNTGRSCFMRSISNVKPKISFYPFTTLFPYIGSLNFLNKDIKFVDIPSFIEGKKKKQFKK